jgi:hypothetical protein
MPEPSTPSTPDFRDLTYLRKGSAIQLQGLRAIEASGILETLREFNPVLAGTLPLDLFVDGSDLDILCQAADLSAFHTFATRQLSGHDKFRIFEYVIRGEHSVVVNFRFQGFEFEVFAQKIPVNEQMAYRHLLIEFEVLARSELLFRERIKGLKQQGLKTEPAFAQLLNLQGDPYLALLAYKLPETTSLSDD